MRWNLLSSIQAQYERSTTHSYTDVYRKEHICISYYNEKWEFVEENYDGYSARIIQHEYDHLEGILFTDHLSVLKRKMLQKKLSNISKGVTDVNYKMNFPNNKKR